MTGLSIYNQKTQEFEFRPGPIMAQVVLADEINRATPKTQSALLECMEERQATIDGTTWHDAGPVPRHRHPESRSSTRARSRCRRPSSTASCCGCASAIPRCCEEVVILDEQKHTHPLDELEEVLTVDELRLLQAAVREVYVDSAVSDYIVRLVNATRESSRRLPRRLARVARSRSIAPARPTPRCSAATT